MKYIIIDKRMREIEKNLLRSLGYSLIEIQNSNEIYPEISSHVDIFTCKIDDIIIVEKSQYNYIKSKINQANTQIIERKFVCAENHIQKI